MHESYYCYSKVLKLEKEKKQQPSLRLILHDYIITRNCR